jgi:putative endonuclease
LVYVERHGGIEDAIRREKQMKRWKRQWKLRLIRAGNPEWRDLFVDLLA